MSTLTWATGFEHGLATPVTSGGGLFDYVTGTALAVGATAARTGSYGLRIYPTTTATSIGKLVAGTPTYVVGRVYVRFATKPSATTDIIWQVCGTPIFTISFVQSTSKFRAQITGGTSQAGPDVVVDTWYRIDFRFYCGGTTWTIDWQVDGVDQTQATLGGQSASTFTTGTRIGCGDAITMDMYVDDVARSETSGDYPIGAGGVIGLRPNADGTHNNAANIMELSDGTDIKNANGGAAVTAWDVLDEDPWITTANADYVKQSGIEATKYCEINFADTTETVIHGVRAIQQDASSGPAANNAKTYILDSDAQSTTLYSGDVSNTSAYYRSVQVATPSGGWTQAYVNSLKCRFGYSSDVTDIPYWLAIMLEVAYGTVTPSAWIPKVIMVM